MEERQTQIKEGAGLEESKLNVEFIDWLQKWSTPILMVIAVAAVGFMLYRKWEKSKLAEVDRAFAELTAAADVASPNPVALGGIADQYQKIRAVPHIARLKAADEYLRCIRGGIKTGAKVEADGTAPAEDALSAEDRARYLADAKRLYQTVLDQTSGKTTLALHAINAAFGLAAVAESSGDTAGATQAYNQVVQIAEGSGFPEQAAAARKRSENLAKLGTLPKLYAQGELPKPPEPPKPPGSEPIRFDPGLLGTSGATGATGETAATGATGDSGATGNTGSTGTTGEPPKPETPPPAPTGSTAPTGTPAPTGSPAAPK